VLQLAHFQPASQQDQVLTITNEAAMCSNSLFVDGSTDAMVVQYTSVSTQEAVPTLKPTWEPGVDTRHDAQHVTCTCIIQLQWHSSSDTAEVKTYRLFTHVITSWHSALQATDGLGLQQAQQESSITIFQHKSTQQDTIECFYSGV
jgi:hypothetical protein